MVHFSKTLYARNKAGETKRWSIRVDGTYKRGVITIETQAKEGASPIVRNEDIREGKNIGRSNETTALEQAILEAKARVEEKITKKGYVEDQKKIGAYLTNSFGLPIPMLAKEYEPDRDYPQLVYLQRKYNGHRAMLQIGPNGGTFYSRGGKEIFTMTHIRKWSNNFEEKYHGLILDGELYTHDIPLQEQTSWIKKYHRGDSEKIDFHIYDIIDLNKMDRTYVDRLRILDNLKVISPFVKVETFKVELNIINTYVDQFILDGYEGGIVRLPDGIYEPGQRSSSLLKVKRFKDAEWKIKDIYEGASITINGKNQTAVCVLCTGSCGDFEVTAPGTRLEQHEFLKKKKKLIGKMLTIKYYDITKDGIPFHPVALQFRTDI